MNNFCNSQKSEKAKFRWQNEEHFFRQNNANLRSCEMT